VQVYGRSLVPMEERRLREAGEGRMADGEEEDAGLEVKVAEEELGRESQC